MREEELKIRQQMARSFQEIATIADLARLINETDSFLYPHSHKEIPLKDITYFSNYKLARDVYHTFQIPKKNGKMREIQTPVKKLKRIQRCLNFILSGVYTPHPAAKGFVLGQNVSDAAKPHVKMPFVFHLDLKDFFTSISLYRVKACLTLPPFHLSGEKEKIAYCIANLCCTHNEEKAFLPQGAPTSPLLSNVVCQRLDRKLTGAAKRFHARYTRYADDITFSSYRDIAGNPSFREEITKIISEQHFCLQPSKTRAEGRGYRQTVCGLTVNEKVNVSKPYVRQMRMYLYLWEHYGYGRAQMYLATDIRRTQGEKADIPQLSHFLSGKLEYMRMIKGNEDATYRTLHDRWLRLQLPHWDKWQENIHLFCEAVQKPAISTEELCQWYKNICNNIDLQIIRNTPLHFAITKALSYLTLRMTEATSLPVAAPQRHNALLLPAFLYENFSKNDPLKFITHSWDGNTDRCKFEGYEDFLRKIQGEFKKINEPFKEIDKSLFACFYGFTHETLARRGWGQHKIKANWCAPWLKNWCTAHPDRSPFDCPIPEEKQETVHNVRLHRFSDVIEAFQAEFQFRPETHRLKKLLQELKQQHLQFDFQVTIKVEAVKLYTDVQAVRNVLSDILHDMAQRKQFPEILLRVEDTGKEYADLLLCQKESDYRGSHQELLRETESGDFCEWKRRMAHLCDWAVETSCKDGFFRIHYLSSKQTGESTVEPLDQVDGFTHRLRFYKHYALKQNREENRKENHPL